MVAASLAVPFTPRARSCGVIANIDINHQLLGVMASSEQEGKRGELICKYRECAISDLLCTSLIEMRRLPCGQSQYLQNNLAVDKALSPTIR